MICPGFSFGEVKMAQTFSRSAKNGGMMQRHNGMLLNRFSQGLFILLGLFVVYVLGRAFSQNPKVFVEQVLNGLQLGFIYALIALGYTMIYGIVKLINFAHGDVFMFGAFTSFYAIATLQLHRWPAWLFPGISEGLTILIGTVSVILAAMLFSAMLAVVIERFAYKPLRNKPRIAALITAIGVSFFLEYFGALSFAFTNNYITYPRSFEVSVYSGEMISPLLIGGAWVLFAISLLLNGWFTWMSRHGNVQAQTWKRHPLLQFGLLFFGFMAAVLTLTGAKIETGGKVWDLSVSNVMLVIMGASILLQVLLQYVVSHTRIGKAMRAAAYDKAVARLMGINVDGVITATFALGGGLAGAAGVLYATAFKQVHHLMGIIPGLKAFVAAVVGGIGSIPGAFVGSLIMGQTEVLAAGFISTPMRDAVAFSLLIVVLLVWPQGIFGEPPAEKV
jgi:branched-chain amino acid transport system permease protein